MPPQRLRRVKLSIRLFILANSACRRVGHGGPSIPQIQLPDRLARLHELSPRAMLIFLSTNLLRPAGPFASCLPAHLMRQCTRGCIKDTENDNSEGIWQNHQYANQILNAIYKNKILPTIINSYVWIIKVKKNSYMWIIIKCEIKIE